MGAKDMRYDENGNSNTPGGQVSANLWSRIVALSNDLGLSIADNRGIGNYQYTAGRFCVPFGSVEGVMHELAHWAVASPTERALDNFGLHDDYSDESVKLSVLREEQAYSLELYWFGDRVDHFLDVLSARAYESRPANCVMRDLRRGRGELTADEETLKRVTVAYAQRYLPGDSFRPDGSARLRSSAISQLPSGFPIRELTAIARQLVDQRRVGKREAESNTKHFTDEEPRACGMSNVRVIKPKKGWRRMSDRVKGWRSWSNTELIDYIEAHSKTEQALFVRDMIVRLMRLAGSDIHVENVEHFHMPYEAAQGYIFDARRAITIRNKRTRTS